MQWISNPICEAVAFLDFVLADNDFGDLEGVPLLFTEALIAPEDVQYSDCHGKWTMKTCQDEVCSWQDLTAGTQPFTLSGTSTLFVPEAQSTKFWQFLKEESFLPGWGGVPTASTGQCCLFNMKNQWYAMAFLSLFMHVSLWVGCRCCALSESFLQICQQTSSFGSKDHACRIYVYIYRYICR